jgi:DNA-directed RNA polymerase specialized sigma24 family protein
MSSHHDDGVLREPPDPRFQRLLDQLNVRERDALFRFYCLQETPEQICRATGIREADLRVLRSNIRAEFRKLGNSPG